MYDLSTIYVQPMNDLCKIYICMINVGSIIYVRSMYGLCAIYVRYIFIYSA